MSMLKTLGALVVLTLVGLAWVSAEQGRGGATALSGEDYAEIMNLYARYSQGSDFQDAELFLSAFSEDATIVRPNESVSGMDALRQEREERYQGRTGDNGRRHRTASYLIAATPQGATGRAYWTLLDVTTRPAAVASSGYYDDEFVRTPAGWKIRRRTIAVDPPTE